MRSALLIMHWLPLVALIAPRAYGQCVMPGSIQEEFNSATVVFVGTVTAVHYIPNTECCHVYSGTATFRVKRWWKGPGRTEFELGASGYLFGVGKEYVVFAAGTPPVATACNRAKLATESAETLRWLTEGSSLVSAAWSAAAQSIARLPPDGFKELPVTIRRELMRRACTIPQPAFPHGPGFRNVARGNYFGTGSDWAVLCSRNLTSSILVFRGGRSDRVSELGSKRDEDFLQGTGGGAIVFSRAIRTVTPSVIAEFQQSNGDRHGAIPRHDGIDDMFLGKASVVWYWRGGKWVVVGGAD